MLGSQPGGDKHSGGLAIDVSSVPTTGRIDDIFARADLHSGGRAIGMLLMQCHCTRGAQHNFVTFRVHFPTVPAFAEGVERNQPAFRPV